MSSFFLGANTPVGFYSLFDELYCPEDGWRMYIIKGGPGTGKSTLMKKIASECDRRGLYCERIFCSSDPESLDAVIIESMKISIADGTSPHTLEPKYPGAVESVLELGRFRDDGLLRGHKEEIISKTKENSLCHKRCIDFLAAAKSAHNDSLSLCIASMRMERLHKFAEKLGENKLKSYGSGEGRVKKRFLSAITPEGFTVFTDTFTGLCENAVILKDPFACASGVILKILSLKATEQGLDHIVCYSPLSPGFSPLHLIIPSLSLGFFTRDSLHGECAVKGAEVDCLRFFNTEMLSSHKNRLAFNKRSFREFMSEAEEKLRAAKTVHDELETYYKASMDYCAVNQYGEEIISEIFGKC